MNMAMGMAKQGANFAMQGKDAMESKAHDFKELLESWLKQKIQKQLESIVDRLPQILKDAVEDPEMPRVVSRGKDAAIDIAWPDFREEIMWEIAVLLDGDAKEEIEDGSKACCFFRFFRYHLFPNDKTIWGKLRDPIFVIFTLISLIPIQGVSQLIYCFIFFIIDKRDEFQLLQFILQFKGTQFISHGIIRTLTGFFLYVQCATAPGDEDDHSCEKSGPGMAGNFVSILGFWLLQIVVVWFAYLFLPCSQAKGRSQLKGQVAFEESTNMKRKGGYLIYIMLWDVVSFICCAAVLGYVISTRPPSDMLDWPVQHAFFGIQIVYGFTAMPFFFFSIPLLQTVLTHTVPTAYDKRGMTRKIKGPPKKRNDEQSKLGAKELVSKQEADKMLGKIKSMFFGGKVDDDDDENAPVCTAT